MTAPRPAVTSSGAYLALAHTVHGEPSPAGVVIKPNGQVLLAMAPNCPRCDMDDIDPSCDCVTSQDRLEKFNRARIPARYLHATLQSLDPDGTDGWQLARFYQWIMAFSTTEPLSWEGILVSGPCGVGKTHAMAALLRHLTLGRGVAALFADFKLLLQDIRSAFAGRGTVHEHIEPVKNAPVLVLDDVTDANGSQWARELLDELISARYNAAVPTLLTTGLSLSGDGPHRAGQFDRWALPHTTSRLRQMCHWLTVTGPDRRAKPR